MLEYIYQATGLLLILFAIQTFLDKQNTKRIGTGLFWLIYGLTFTLGKVIPDWAIGAMVIVLTVIATAGLMGIGSYKPANKEFAQEQASSLKNKLFIPALIVPVVTLLWHMLTGTSALIGLGVSSLIAFIVAMQMTKCSVNQGLHEGRRLLDTIGWAAILSQFLAALGYLFGQAEVGTTVAQIIEIIIPENNLVAYVLAYTFGMAIFTIVMGNAFAAFAVITTGIALPLLIIGQGGDPIIIGVLGMLSGYCGTLMTPMAANFNIVPAALLELKDKNHIIKVQIIPGFIMLLLNSIMMYLFAF